VTPTPYTPPTWKSDGFNCPACNAYADQRWGMPHLYAGDTQQDPRYLACCCMRCRLISIWVDQRMVYPVAHSSPPPNGDLPDDIRTDYEEARAILSDSPRGSAALLRLCIQKLCKLLGQKGKNINEDIAALVQSGLPVQVQQALDIVRVVGNNAVHPGTIDLNDDPATANKLFDLVNLIADVMITQPKHVKEIYESTLLENQREAIRQRDGT
jgi:Domain of unknown function (DUF4145)